MARDSMTFETLAHAVTSTSPNAANTGERTARSSSDNRLGVACGRTSARRSPAIRFGVDERGHHRRQRRLGLGRGHAGAEAHGDLDAPRRVRPEDVGPDELGVGGQRDPHVLRIVVEAGELRAQHADDRELPAVEIEVTAEDGGIAREEPRPCLVAQHGHRRARVGGAEGAAEEQARRQRLEVVLRHEVRRQRAALGRHEPRVLGDRRLEQVAAFAQRLVVAPAKLRPAVVLRAPDDAVQGTGIADGERAQHVGVEDREDDGQQAQGDGEGEDRGRDERGTLRSPRRP